MRAVLDKLLLCRCPPVATSTGGCRKPCQGHATRLRQWHCDWDAFRDGTLCNEAARDQRPWTPGLVPRTPTAVPSLPPAGSAWLGRPGQRWGIRQRPGSPSARGLLATPHCTSLTSRPPLPFSCLRSLFGSCPSLCGLRPPRKEERWGLS